MTTIELYPDDWLCTFGQTQRLSLFPLFPMEAADDPLLVRMALAADDEELARAATDIAARRHELNPGVPSLAGAAASSGAKPAVRQP